LTCAVLTYHSQNISGNQYGENDHICLQQDLEFLHKSGKRLIPLTVLVDWLLSGSGSDELDDAVCITFDDGCKLEVSDEIVPPFGEQPSFLQLLKAFGDRLPADTRHQVHATTFVIADETVRNQIDRESLFSLGWMQSDWWAVVKAEGIIDVQSHGWDHKHTMKAETPGHSLAHARFESVNTFAECELQVYRASQLIAAHCNNVQPQYFAYPFGSASDYMRTVYLPENLERTGIRAAFSTRSEHVGPEASRWNIPRYVCGRDWKTPEQFEMVLSGSLANLRAKL